MYPLFHLFIPIYSFIIGKYFPFLNYLENYSPFDSSNFLTFYFSHYFQCSFFSYFLLNVQTLFFCFRCIHCFLRLSDDLLSGIFHEHFFQCRNTFFVSCWSLVSLDSYEFSHLPIYFWINPINSHYFSYDSSSSLTPSILHFLILASAPLQVLLISVQWSYYLSQKALRMNRLTQLS